MRFISSVGALVLLASAASAQTVDPVQAISNDLNKVVECSGAYATLMRFNSVASVALTVGGMTAQTDARDSFKTMTEVFLRQTRAQAEKIIATRRVFETTVLPAAEAQGMDRDRLIATTVGAIHQGDAKARADLSAVSGSPTDTAKLIGGAAGAAASCDTWLLGKAG